MVIVVEIFKFLRSLCKAKRKAPGYSQTSLDTSLG